MFQNKNSLDLAKAYNNGFDAGREYAIKNELERVKRDVEALRNEAPEDCTEFLYKVEVDLERSPQMIVGKVYSELFERMMPVSHRQQAYTVSIALVSPISGYKREGEI